MDVLYTATKSSATHVLSTEMHTAFTSLWNLSVSRCLRFWDVAKCFCDCGQVMLSEMENGVRLAQLVECDWKARYSTDTYLNPRWGKWFFFQSTFGADSLMVSTQPLCPIACINISAHIKNPKHRQPYHCLDTWKYCTHWLVCICTMVVLLLQLL